MKNSNSGKCNKYHLNTDGTMRFLEDNDGACVVSERKLFKPVWQYPNIREWGMNSLGGSVGKLCFRNTNSIWNQTDSKQCFVKPEPDSENVLLLAVYTPLLIFGKHNSMFSSLMLKDIFHFNFDFNLPCLVSLSQFPVSHLQNDQKADLIHLISWLNPCLKNGLYLFPLMDPAYI